MPRSSMGPIMTELNYIEAKIHIAKGKAHCQALINNTRYDRVIPVEYPELPLFADKKAVKSARAFAESVAARSVLISTMALSPACNNMAFRPNRSINRMPIELSEYGLIGITYHHRDVYILHCQSAEMWRDDLNDMAPDSHFILKRSPS